MIASTKTHPDNWFPCRPSYKKGVYKVRLGHIEIDVKEEHLIIQR